MPQPHSIPCALLIKYLAAAALAGAMLLVINNAAWAEKAKTDRAVRLLDTVPIPVVNPPNTTGGLYSFDISWVDQATETYYLADRSNAVVDIVDAKSNILLVQLSGGFAGLKSSTSISGPHGVTTSGHCLFVTDAPSRVVSFDTTPLPLAPKFVSAVMTDPSSPNRADELAVDPKDSLILAINNADAPPFGTFIKFDAGTCKLTQPVSPGADRVTFDTATNGAEQPLWDPRTQKFYLSIPSVSGTVGNPGPTGAVFRIDPTTKTLDNNKTYKVTYCSPAGLTKGPNNDVLIGCNVVFDILGNRWTGNADLDPNTAAPIQVILDVKTGEQDRVGGVGAGDEVWFNQGDGNYYTASSGSPLVPNAITPARPPLGTATTAPVLTAQGAAILGVIDAKDGQVLQLVPTLNVPAVTAASGDKNPHVAGTAHSVAADAKNNHIFVPLPANNVYPSCTTGCVAVYGHPDEDEPGAVALPPP